MTGKKKSYLKLNFIYILILIILSINSALANLMIAPQRIILKEKERSASVNLINTSNSTTTYRLHWVQKKQGSNSRYIDLPPDSNEVPNASTMLRFSPRQITLAPGEKQTVRIAVRRKQNLTAGEYRSHLLFQALPKKEINESGQTRVRTKINLLLGFSIPVIIRQGKLNGEAKIIGTTIQKTLNNEKVHYGLQVTLKRQGPHTTYGTLNVFWKPSLISTYKKLATLNNIALYPESNIVNYYIGLKDFKPNNGYIRVVYEGKKEYRNKIFDSNESQLDTNNIVIKNIQ